MGSNLKLQKKTKSPERMRIMLFQFIKQHALICDIRVFYKIQGSVFNLFINPGDILCKDSLAKQHNGRTKQQDGTHKNPKSVFHLPTAINHSHKPGERNK